MGIGYKYKQSTRADTDYGSYRRVAGKRSSLSPKAPLANAQLVFQPFQWFPPEQMTFIKHLRQQGVKGSDEESCRFSGEALFNLDRMAPASNFEPERPFFYPRSLTMKRSAKAEEPERKMTSKRVKELPWLRLKRRRAGKG